MDYPGIRMSHILSLIIPVFSTSDYWLEISMNKNFNSGGRFPRGARLCTVYCVKLPGSWFSIHMPSSAGRRSDKLSAGKTITTAFLSGWHLLGSVQGVTPQDFWSLMICESPIIPIDFHLILLYISLFFSLLRKLDYYIVSSPD